MHEYDFISKSITKEQVEEIITRAGYIKGDYTYSKRVDSDGYLVKGNTVMSLTTLKNAAKALDIKRLEISSPPSGTEAAGYGAGRQAEDDAPSSYQVSIDLSSNNTYAQLNAQKYLLYGFKVVQTTATGVPVVWFALNSQTTPFLTSHTVAWSEQYQGYITDAQAITNGQITGVTAWDMSLGDVVDVATNDVTGGGTPSTISINNTTNYAYTCGISQVQGDTPTPMCAFPLNGNHMDLIAPIEKILLMFSTEPVNTGTVVEQAYSQGILIDLTSAQSRAVIYDINDGWSTAGGQQSWATIVPANAYLVPMLIDNTSPSFRRRLRA